jgi:error-prone DNA polymerase
MMLTIMVDVAFLVPAARRPAEGRNRRRRDKQGVRDEVASKVSMSRTRPPKSAKGIVFITVEDEHGVGNLVVYPDVTARDRAALVAGRLLLAEGRIEREVKEVKHAEVPITHLIVRRLVDRSDLLDGLAAVDGPAATGWADRMLGRADEVRRPEPGSQRTKLPGSRDFR